MADGPSQERGAADASDADDLPDTTTADATAADGTDADTATADAAAADEAHEPAAPDDAAATDDGAAAAVDPAPTANAYGATGGRAAAPPAGGGAGLSTGPGRSSSPIPSLLESLNQDYLDPGYAAAARRATAGGGRSDRPSTGRARTTALLVAALVVVGVLFGIAAGSAESNAPRTEKARSALLEDIDRAEQQQSALAGSATDLAEQLRATQSALGAAGPLETVAELENAGQITPVTGPGLRIVIDEAPADGSAATGGAIQDRDVQLLVNDLWAAGAEAISIGGVRVQPRSAIRQAGGSILVDNRPVFWPITVEAIGNSSAMQVNLVGSPGFGRFNSFAQLYGIEFDVSAQQELRLPGGPGADLLFAHPLSTAAVSTVPAASAPTTQGPGPAEASAPPPAPTSSPTS